MDRSLARRLLLIALVIGILAELGLDGPAWGVNVPILVAAVLAAGWLVRRRGRAPDPLDAWLPVTALVLAGFVAIRADGFIALLDALGAATFTGASLAAFSGIAITRRSASVVLAMAAWALEAVLAGTGRAVRLARPAPTDQPRRAPIWAGGVARGLVLAVPLVLIFAVLFASADPIFGRAVDTLLGLEIDLGTLPGRLLFVLATTWLAGGLLSIAARGLAPVELASLGAAARTAPLVRERLLGLTEARIVLGALVVVSGCSSLCNWRTCSAASTPLPRPG